MRQITEREASRKLKPGHYRVGPERSIGCYNTGHAPVIARTHILCWKDGADDVFLVGAQLLRHEAWLNWIEQGKRKRVIRLKSCGSTWTYRFFKTWRAAHKTFQEMCTRNLASQNEEREEARRQLKRARSADPTEALAGMLALGEYL